jgi:hypothetical protein
VSEPAEKKSGRGLRAVLALFGCGVLAGGLCLVQEIRLETYNPGFERRDNETAAIDACKTIAMAESIFREQDKDENGALDYGSLAQLSATQLVDDVLGSGTKTGYLFRVAASVSTSEFLWFATASPAEPGVTGNRYFCTNSAGIIFCTTTGPFSLNTTDCVIPANAIPVGK